MKLLKQQYNVLLFLIFITEVLFAQNVEQLLKLGDNEVNKTYNYAKGLEYYNSALKLEPNNPIILNKISKAIVFIGDDLPASIKNIEQELKFGEGLNTKKESLDSNEIAGAQVDNYEKAYELANKAIELDPNNAEAYVRRAIANARIAEKKGIFSVAKLVNQVKDDLEFAIKLGTGGKDVQAVAHYVLAKVHDKVSDKWKPARSVIGLGWGDIDVALEEYKKAIKLKSDVRAFYLDYAKALIEEDEDDEAKAMLLKIESCPILEKDDAKRLKEAKKLLAEL